jgi:acyl-CoA synthetase (AMP-forming)/AMP-acid ligase II
VNNVAAYLAQQADSQPEGVAVIAPLKGAPTAEIRFEQRTFAELNAESDAVCHYFTRQGMRRGDRVLLMVKPGLDLIRIVFALFKMGAVPVTIDPGMGLRGFLRCVQQSQPRYLVGIPLALIIARMFSSKFRSLQGRIRIDRKFGRTIQQAAVNGKPFATANVERDELAAILFTSGSTGPAKGVCYAHGMFAEQVQLIRETYGIAPGEVDLPMLPVFALFNPALGMTTVVPQMNPSRPAQVDPRRIVQAIRQFGVTNSFGSPTLWTKIARHCQREGITLPGIRRILVAGAPVPPALMRMLRTVCPNGQFHTPYGATEALPVSSISAETVLTETASAQERGEGTCVGHPLKGMRVRIVEASDAVISSLEQAQAVETGTIGEIIVNGPVVTRSYDNLPEATAAAKIADGDSFWHRMGDVGYLDEQGRLWFCGRKVERVHSAQGILYTEPCEAIFNQHPRVFRSALIGIGPNRTIPAMVIEPEKGDWPRGKRLRKAFIAELKALAGKHSHTAAIRHYFFCRHFPVDVRHNAKIHRRTLAQQYAKCDE